MEKTIFFLISFLVLSSFALAETTFFDNPDDSFVMGYTEQTSDDSIDSASSSESSGQLPSKQPYNSEDNSSVNDTYRTNDANIDSIPDDDIQYYSPKETISHSRPFLLLIIAFLLFIIGFVIFRNRKIEGLKVNNNV